MPAETPPAAPTRPAGRAFPDAVAGAFERRYGHRPEVLVRAPGRVSLLGAHVDYSEGWVITGAIDRAVWLAAAPAEGRTARIYSLDFDEAASVDLDRPPPPLAQRPETPSRWIDYPAGLVWALGEAGIRPAAMDVAFGGDLPAGAGVSSSAAVEMAFLLAVEALHPGGGSSLGLDGAARARLGMRVENAYLGVQSGIMDQFSCLHGAAGRLVFLDCRTLGFERLPLPRTALVLVADSGVRRRLVDLDYNDRREECARAVKLLERHLPGIRTLRDVEAADFQLHAHRLPMDLRRRARHAIEECRRVRDGAAALRRGDLEAFGELIRRSHESSRDLYEVSTPELDVLAAAAWGTPGCYGARLAGGGFGGCVTALVEASAADDVRRAMIGAFEEELGRAPAVFACAIAEGAGVTTPRGRGTRGRSRR